MAAKRIICIIMSVVLVVVLAFPVYAVSNVASVDYRSLISYSDVDGANNIYGLSIPSDWRYIVFGSSYGLGYSFGDSEITDTYAAEYGENRITIYPFGSGFSTSYGSQYAGRAMSLTNIPVGSQLSFAFQLDFVWPFSITDFDSCKAQLQMVYLDVNGKCLSALSTGFKTTITQFDTEAIVTNIVSCTLNPPSGAAYVVPRFWVYSVAFTSSPVTFTVDFSEFNFQLSCESVSQEALNDQIIEGKLDEISGNQSGTNDRLDQIADNQQQTNGKLDTIAGNQEQANEKLDTIAGNQEQTNEKLDGIQDSITNLPEQEKQEANASGNDSVDQLTEAIPDQSQGFMDAIKNLASSMSYGGTTALLTIPQINFPDVGPVQGFVILKPQRINFSQFIAMMPDDLLLLVQSLFTIALIVYCFKELYGTIQYVLTMKGGGE